MLSKRASREGHTRVRLSGHKVGEVVNVVVEWRVHPLRSSLTDLFAIGNVGMCSATRAKT